MISLAEFVVPFPNFQVSRIEHNQITSKSFKEPQDSNRSGKDVGSGKPLLPGKANVFVKTWGCSHNNSDGEYMAGLLAAEGYSITKNKAEANVWLLNSCTVKNPSQDVFINEVKAGKEAGASVVVAGCVPQGQPNNKDLEGLSMIGVQQIDRVVEVVEETLKGSPTYNRYFACVCAARKGA